MNAAICVICGDLIQSCSVHDMNTCRCGCISVDGGDEYKKRMGVHCAVYEVIDRDTFDRLHALDPSQRTDHILHDHVFEKNWHILCLLFAARNANLEERIADLEEEFESGEEDNEDDEEDEDDEEEEEYRDTVVFAITDNTETR